MSAVGRGKQRRRNSPLHVAPPGLAIDGQLTEAFQAALHLDRSRGTVRRARTGEQDQND
jgi:hypothetical protein